MTYNFTVSPDFNPNHLSGWFIFNTWLQKAIGEGIHLELFDDFDSQRRAIADNQFDLIYANPYDASLLVREKGFLPLVSPQNKSDEAIIAVRADCPAHVVEDLKPGLRISSTDDPDVNMMCMIMLEPCDLSAENTVLHRSDTYVIVAKNLIQGDADVGFFLEETYSELSNMIRSQLRPLVQSQIQVINHVLLVGPRLIHMCEAMGNALMTMTQEEKGQGVLESLGFSGWETVSEEDTEFMIDLMDTLED
ncbi:MAG TPA: phosphate/phosphite/phosphonate ABC transporter substrate-binding protein [Candidatus Tenderia sp.]|nr:phosphate/phosphite/phosphonate ABC transporter substrate-binding protein [Candidatus Tenderia sp.]